MVISGGTEPKSKGDAWLIAPPAVESPKLAQVSPETVPIPTHSTFLYFGFA